MLPKNLIRVNGKELEFCHINDLIDEHVNYKKGLVDLETFYQDFKDLQCYEVISLENIEFLEVLHHDCFGKVGSASLDDYFYLKTNIQDDPAFKENFSYLNCYHIKDIDDFKSILDDFDKQEEEHYKKFYSHLDRKDFYLGFCELEILLFLNK
jgi:hypothetical protein